MTNNKEKAQEHVKKFKDTHDLLYFREAFKIDYGILWDEEVKRLIESFLRPFAINPYPGKLIGLSPKEVREFFDELQLIKPDEKPEVRVFLGYGCRLESCLGFKFTFTSRPQLIAYDNAVLVYFVEELSRKWIDFCKESHTNKFSDYKIKRQACVKFCKGLGLTIPERALKWGSMFHKSIVALTIIGIVNQQRWEIFLKHLDSDPIKEVFDSLPYFSFQTLYNLYKRAKKEVDPAELLNAEDKINFFRNKINPQLEKIIETITSSFGVNKEFSISELEEKCEFKGETLKRYLKALEGFNIVTHNGRTGKHSRYMLLLTWSLMSDKRVCANPNPLGLYVVGWHGYELDPSELPNAERL